MARAGGGGGGERRMPGFIAPTTRISQGLQSKRSV
jgi:hypothetical protein